MRQPTDAEAEEHAVDDGIDVHVAERQHKAQHLSTEGGGDREGIFNTHGESCRDKIPSLHHAQRQHEAQHLQGGTAGRGLEAPEG
jgi:hypothetical protein